MRRGRRNPSRPYLRACALERFERLLLLATQAPLPFGRFTWPLRCGGTRLAVQHAPLFVEGPKVKSSFHTASK